MNRCLYKNNEYKYQKQEIDLNSFVVALFLALFFLAFAVLQFGNSLTVLQAISFSINGIFIYLMLFRGLSKFSFSIDLIHSVFCLLFFWIAPILQVSSGFNAWGLSVKENDIIRANIFILLWLMFYNIGALCCNGSSWKAKQCSYSVVSKKLIYVILFAMVIITLNYIRKNGLDFGKNSFVETETQSIGLLLNHCITAFVTFGTIIIINWARQTKQNKIFIIVSIVCLLLSCFPTAMSRYAAGSIYCCLLLTLIPWFREKHRMVMILLIGMAVLFPIMDLYRYKSFSEVTLSDIQNQFANLSEYFSSGNYDAYQMIIAATRSVEKVGHTYGNQLLGTLFFFFPRKFWSNKPVSTGTYIANTLGWDFGNISSPLLAEAYVDFGVLGIVFFAIFCGYMINKIDNTYWNGEKSKLSFINLIYFYIVPYFLFVCRGSLMSTWAYLFANIFVLFVLEKTVDKFEEKQRN